MKCLILLIPILLLYSCGPDAAGTANQSIIQDSISAVAQFDSIETAKIMEELKFFDSTKNEYQKMYDAALVRLDSLTGEESDWGEKPVPGMDKILKVKRQIGVILEKHSLTDKDKTKVQFLVTELNNIIDDLIKSVTKAK
jgi:hypothetical protein